MQGDEWRQISARSQIVDIDLVGFADAGPPACRARLTSSRCFVARQRRDGSVWQDGGRLRDRRPHDGPTLAPKVTRSSSNCSNCSPHPLVLPEAIASSMASFEG